MQNTKTFNRCQVTVCRAGLAVAVFAAYIALNSWSGTAVAGFRASAVGGIDIDAHGVVSRPAKTEYARLQAARQRSLKPVPGDLTKFTPERRVSLRRLEEAISRHRENRVTPLADEMRYLAGLQRIEYVFVYPEQNDVVLVGPAEGWRADENGNVVGLTTRRPVLLLDDLIVALRTARSSMATGISCSIDPTPQGLQNVNKLFRKMKSIDQPNVAIQRVEQAMGPQVITVTGVPTNSYFARVMVAADFRMKRIAMDFEPAPIEGMPSYLQLIANSRSSSKNMLPRWWLEPNYEPLLTDGKGLAWEIRGKGVKCMTEQDRLAEDGTLKRGAAAGSKAARQWADTFTDKFEQVADKDSTFGQLRNVMDLAVVAALIEKEGLLARAGLELPQLMDNEAVGVFNSPRQVPTQVRLIQTRHDWLMSASGGVQIIPWKIIEHVETSDTLSAKRKELSGKEYNWWSD